MRTARGTTLIEVMMAMAVLMIGAAGVVGLQRQSQNFLGDARRLTRASFVAQDLANQIQLWRFDDPRLTNDTSNDADIADDAGLFLTEATPFADHGEADLTAGGMSWNGLPSAALAPSRMERFWNVAHVAGEDDANENGVWDSVRIAVIVRWPVAGGWRRYVFYTVKVNPEDRR